MIRVQSKFGKSVAVTSVFSLVIAMVPGILLAETGKAVREAMPKPKPEPALSRVLSAKTMKAMQGRAGENPYAAGQAKWDVVYKGVNLMNGNYSTSGTDLTFEGGYGIPVNVTRSYSANNGEEGPLGKGWTLSVDVRSTAGGLMKSGSAPVRAVPVNFKERPSAQVDPNAVTADGAQVQPVAAVLATDSGGTEETISRDVDGILSTPPWDKNKIESEYETIIKPDGSNVRIMKKNYVNTPEGTVYVYEKKGVYLNGGTRPFNNPSATPEESNVLKITTATDRHGNVTNYTYDSAPANAVSFVKSNGTTSEAPLKQIQMPNGHVITFTWTGNRITRASDGVRHVDYGYTNGLLTSVTTPGGKTTGYVYGTPWVHQDFGGTVPSGLLTQIIDPRGLSQTISYQMLLSESQVPTPMVVKIMGSNGTGTLFKPAAHSTELVGTTYYNWSILAGPYFPVAGIQFVDYVQSGLVTYNYGQILTGVVDGAFMVMVMSSPSGATDTYTAITSTSKTDYYDLDTNDLVLSKSQSCTGNAWETYQNYDSNATNFNPYLGRTWQYDIAATTTKYNFMGNPLSKSTTTNRTTYMQSSPPPVTTSVDYSYWGGDKYYQQKAVKDQAGRYSYTEYYDKNAAQGKKGQTYKVYDGKRTTFVENASIPIPQSVPACPTSSYWKYRLEPQSDTYSAKFDYDTYGRPVDVWKIQKTTTNPWTYVQTHTTYGTNASPVWGAAVSVVEDYGGINRTTETMEYDNIGRAIRVKDASGKEFKTNYDLDGVIQSIQRVDGGLNQNVVSYTYGTTGVLNGAVLSVTDNLSGVSQAMSYFTTGSSVGQVQSVTETNGTDVYSSAYTYYPTGDRETSTYTTQAALGQSSTTKWRYDYYRNFGGPLGGSRAFRRLVRLDPATNQPTSEEFNYNYDTNGRLQEATFAMTPNSAVTAPMSNGSWYNTSDKPAATRGRAHYEYTMTGQLKGIYNWWDTWNSGTQSYTSSFVRGNECDYEVTTGLKRGLKTASRYLTPVSGQPLNWQTQRQETYSYDASLDYLVGASYGDGLPNANVTWGYDAAGNRVSDSAQPGAWSYDNLNRMTASPGASYTNDILGNRTWKSDTQTDGSAYSWDMLNRLTQLDEVGNDPIASYQYRADGLRVKKVTSSGTTNVRYDGQMGTEDVELNGSGTITGLTRYGLGARGIDVVSRTTNSGNTVSYPLYDAHGNNVGALSKSGSSFVVSDEKSYDAWGGLRSGTNANGKAAYCANLGHKQDDESGLIYMRARYYEPTSGRFVSEDLKQDGRNWYAYCSNDPVNRIDADGNDDAEIAGELVTGLIRQFGLAGTAFGALAAAWLTKLLTNLVTKGLDEVKEWLDKVGNALITGGKAEFDLGVANFNEARGSGASLGEALGAGRALGHMGSGIAKIFTGGMLKLLKFMMDADLFGGKG